MPDVLDLSQLKKNTPPELTPEQEQAVAQMAAQEGMKVRTAFLVIIDEDGAVLPLADLDMKVVRRWTPTPHDIVAAAAILQHTATAELSGSYAAMAVQQMANAQMQAMQNQQLAQQLNL